MIGKASTFTLAITTTAVPVLGASVGQSRGYLAIYNTGTAPFLVGFDGDPTAAGAVAIPVPVGGSFEPAEAMQNAIWLAAVGGSTTVAVLTGEARHI